jgi:hypothetical protein
VFELARNSIPKLIKKLQIATVEKKVELYKYLNFWYFFPSNRRTIEILFKKATKRIDLLFSSPIKSEKIKSKPMEEITKEEGKCLKRIGVSYTSGYRSSIMRQSNLRPRPDFIIYYM